MTVQVTLTVFRVVMVTIMMLTILVAYIHQDNEFDLPMTTTTTASEPSYYPDGGSGCSWLCFHIDKLYILLPIAAQAYVFHHSIPGLSHMVGKEERACMSTVFAFALAVSFLAYTALAVSVSLYFDVNTLSPSNLNWVPYRGTIHIPLSQIITAFCAMYVCTSTVLFLTSILLLAVYRIFGRHYGRTQ